MGTQSFPDCSESEDSRAGLPYARPDNEPALRRSQRAASGRPPGLAHVLLALLVLLAAGCSDGAADRGSSGSEQQTQPEAQKSQPAGTDSTNAAGATPPARPLTVPGGTVIPDVAAAGNAGQGGLADAARPGTPTGQPQSPGVRVPTIGKRPARLVNLAEVSKNPRVLVVENKVNPADPLGSVVTRYFDAAARVSTLGLQQAVKAHHALNGRYPTFAEFQQMIRQHRVELAPLPPYQMYAYDEKTGGIVIVEDKDEKIRLYEQNGIPLDPGDEKYR